MKKITLFLAVFIPVLIAAGVFGWFWYDSNVDRSGFVEKNGSRYYQDFHGDPVTGWQNIDDARYFFDTNGAMVTGWQDLDGSRYCFSEAGTLLYGWQDMNGTCYYLDSDGTMATEWQEIDGNRYFFAADGAMVTGQVSLDGQTYCFAQDGAMVTGWLENCYYFDDGTLATGLQELDGQHYLFSEDGILTTGWQEFDGQRYLFSEDGTAYTGWLQEGEYSYYFQEDGSAAVGPTEIDGQTYYFSPSGIHIWLVNPWNYVHEDYEVELVTVEGGYRIAEVCRDALEQMLADCRTSGATPNLCSGYRTYWDQFYLYNAKIEQFGAVRGKQIAAVPGTSEHQLGLAVDITGTAAMAWLQEHCWEYGFILRYTEAKQPITGIIDEPWHFRYVGTEVSMDMKDSGLCLEEYLRAVSLEAAETD